MRVSDYGGHCHERGKGLATGLAKAVLSYRCVGCGRITYYTKAQVSRMKSNPRCGHCGGATEETDASCARRTGLRKKDAGKTSEELFPHLSSKRYECPVCELRFRTEVAMQMHVQDRHGIQETT